MGEVAGGAAGEVNTTLIMTPGAEHTSQSAGASPQPSHVDLGALTQLSFGLYNNSVQSCAGASPQPSIVDLQALSQSGLCIAAGASASSSVISLPGTCGSKIVLSPGRFGQGDVKLSEYVLPENGDSNSGLVIPENVDNNNKSGLLVIPDIRLPMLQSKSETNSLALPGPSSTTPMLFPRSETSSTLIPPGFDGKSETSSFIPICRICHNPDEEEEILISPCRCAGTMQYIHDTCLMRWLEVSSKKSRKPPKCELCHYQYHRHKKFKFHHWRWPRVSKQDKILHIVFIINLIIMIACAIATVMCFLSDKEQITKLKHNKVDLTTEEIITLSCGVLFFVSFFIAMSVQIKAKHTIYQVLMKFIMQNMEWEIDEYDKAKDSLYKSPVEYV